MCYILIVKLFNMVFDFMKKIYRDWRGQNRRDSEEVTSLQGASSNSKPPEKQYNQMGKSKNKKQQDSSSAHSQQSASSTSPYHRRTSHMNQSPDKSAVSHYPQPHQNRQTSHHRDSWSSNSGRVRAQVEAKINELESQCVTQDANGGSSLYKDNINHHPLYQEENETGNYKHTTPVNSHSSSIQSGGKKSSSPLTPTNFIPPSPMEKPPAFNASKFSQVQQTEDTNHCQEPTPVEQTINERRTYMFGGSAQRQPATRTQSHSLLSSDIFDQGQVTTRSQSKVRYSTPVLINPPLINLEEPVFGSHSVQVDSTNKSCTYDFGATPSKNIGMAKTEPNDGFDPTKYIPEGFYVPRIVLKRMHSMKSVTFCLEEVTKLETNNENLEVAMQLANHIYDINNVEEMSELKQKIEEMHKIVHDIPNYECDHYKQKVIDAECGLRYSLQQLENHLSSKVKNMEVEQGEHDMEIEEAEEVFLPPNVDFPPDLDVPPAVAKRTLKRKDSAYTKKQIVMLREMYADLDKVKELLVETNKFSGSYAQLKDLKLKVENHNVKVCDMHHWKYKLLQQKIEKAKQDLKLALGTLGSSERILQDVQFALADTKIDNKKHMELKNLQSSIVSSEKKIVEHLKHTVNLKPQLNEALTLLNVRKRSVKVVLDAFETFGEARSDVKDVQEKSKRIQTVKDAEEGLSKIMEWSTFFEDFDCLGNNVLNNHKETSCRNLKAIKETLLETKKFLEIKEVLDREYAAVNDLANQINGFWGSMAELQNLKQQIQEKQNALSKFSSVESSQLKSMLEQALKMLSDSKNLLEDREVLIEGQSCQGDPEEDVNLEADKPPDLSKMLSESRTMQEIGQITLQLLNVHRQISDRALSTEQGTWIKKQLVECECLLLIMTLMCEVERKCRTHALNFIAELRAKVDAAMKLNQDVPVNISSAALTALAFCSEIQEGQLNRGRARWLDDQVLDCQTRLDAIELPEGVAREARRDVLNLCNEALRSLKALAAQNNW